MTSTDRIPVMLTLDEAETLLELGLEHHGTRCMECRAYWHDETGYDHDPGCTLLSLRKAAQAALPDTPRNRAYAEYLDAEAEAASATTARAIARRDEIGIEEAQARLDAAWAREAEARARYEAIRAAAPEGGER